MAESIICKNPDATFALGDQIGKSLQAGDVVLLYGGLGAGKTLLTKGVLNALDFNIDEVTSPSFTLVNLYETPTFDVYHIDLWRLDAASNVSAAVGLEEILDHENTVVIIEWAEKLGDISLRQKTIAVRIEGDGDEPRQITIERRETCNILDKKS